MIYSFRICTPEDTPVISDFVVKFAEEYYNDIPPNLEKIVQNVSIFLNAPKTERIIIGYTGDDALVGALIAVAEPMLFSDVKLASELMWWVDKDHRGKYSVKMLDYYEEWARQVGCTKTSLASVGDHRARLIYERRGYKLSEQAYVK